MKPVQHSLKEQAQVLDSEDGLRDFKSKFVSEDPDELYMDGNSLGRLPVATRQYLSEVIEHQWGQRVIRSWGENWYDAPVRIGGKVSGLIGAKPGEVMISDSTTINLFKLAVSALKARPTRKKIISDVLNFPTDLYTIQGVIDLLDKGHELVLLSSADEIQISMDDYENALDENTALVTFSTPTFKSGFLHDIPQMTEMAHKAGALVLWDFSHAVGVIPIDVTAWELDFAVGCTYKYVNGGPGAPAFLYINQKMQATIQNQPLGWWGHQNPFAFDLEYQPAGSIRRMLVGTPPVLSLMSIEPAIDLVLQAGINNIRAKSINLTDFFIQAYDSLLREKGYALGSPRDSQIRGGHISLRHKESYRIYQALTNELKVIPDFREPDNIRLGFSPLYTSFKDIYEVVLRLSAVVEEDIFTKYANHRTKVT